VLPDIKAKAQIKNKKPRAELANAGYVYFFFSFFIVNGNYSSAVGSSILAEMWRSVELAFSQRRPRPACRKPGRGAGTGVWA